MQRYCSVRFLHWMDVFVLLEKHRKAESGVTSDKN